jgi:hypothetical protein
MLVVLSPIKERGSNLNLLFDFASICCIFDLINVRYMNIQAEINWIRTELDGINDVNLVAAIKNLLTYAKKTKPNVDFWDTLSDEQRADIDAGIADLEAGRKRPHNLVMKDVKSLLK